MTKTFKRGGVHPDSSKYTSYFPISLTNIPNKVRIAMAQHIGAPAKVIVKVGQEVKEGELIGEADGFVSANVHASVAGIVTAIEKGNTLTAKGVDIVEIKTGGKFKNWYEKKHTYLDSSVGELASDIKKAGVVGLGGAAFPTHVKLSPPKDKPIDTIIINGAECEPYLTIDHRMMLEKTDEILEGIDIIQKILNVRNIYIGIEDNKPDAIKDFKKRLSINSIVKVIPLKAKYPQGGEKQLIEAITGREVPTKGLPMDVGVIVENISTIFAIFEAVAYKKPVIERGITYTGDDIPSSIRGNYKVRIGTTCRQLFNSFGLPEEYSSIISGGPMMGIQITDFDIPITKGVSGITVLPKKKDYKVAYKPCIRCAKCLSVCPIGLEPTELAKFCEASMVDEATEMGLFDCIECGACAYICPSSIPIVPLIRFGKGLFKRRQAKK